MTAIVDLEPGTRFQDNAGRIGRVVRHSPGGTTVDFKTTQESIGETWDGKPIRIPRRRERLQISSGTEVTIMAAAPAQNHTEKEEGKTMPATATKKKGKKTKAPKAKKGKTIREIIRDGLTKGRSDDQILSDVLKGHPNARTGANSLAYYKSELRREGVALPCDQEKASS